MLRVSKQAIFENYIVFMFFVVLLLSLQFGPDRPLIPYAEFVRLGLVLVLFSVSLFTTNWKLVPRYSLRVGIICLLFAFLAWSFLSSTMSGDYIFDSARRAFLAIGTSLMILVSFYLVRPNLSIIKKIILTFLIVATAVSGVGLTMSFWGGEYVSSEGGRAYQTLNILGLNLTHEVHFAGGLPRIASITANPNALGLLAALGCLVSAFLYYSGRAGVLVSVLLFSINMAALIHTFSRSAILGFAITLFVVLLLLGIKKFLLYSILLLTLSVLAFLLFGDFIAGAVEARLGQGMHGRDVIWGTALDSIATHPFTGVGFGLEKEAILLPAGVDWTMHNAYIVVMSEVGMIGFLLFALFLIAANAQILNRIFVLQDRYAKSSIILFFGMILFIMIRGMSATLIMRFTDTNIIFMTLLSCALFAGYEVKRTREIG